MRPARLIDVSLTRLGRADQETSYETLVKQPMPDHCWQLWFFQGVLRGPRNLGTLLYIHQTRRSRDAPGFLRHFPTPGSIIKVQGEYDTRYRAWIQLTTRIPAQAASAPSRWRSK